VQIGNRNHLALAVKDFKDGVSSIYVWPMLGWLEIKQRYRRSVLGPFWLTISTGALIGGMGPLYGRLLGQDVSGYLLYLSIGFVVWFFIANLLNEACNVFISAEGFIKQVRLPLTVHVLRMVWKNLIIFAHNVLIVFAVLLFFRPPVGWNWLLVPVGLFFIAINGVWIGLFLGTLCARFRDVPQIVSSLVQVVFFLTPVIWQAEMLGRNQWAATWNPFYHFLEVVRAPLVVGTTNWFSWAAVLCITLLGYTVTLPLFARFRARIAYWV